MAGRVYRAQRRAGQSGKPPRPMSGTKTQAPCGVSRQSLPSRTTSIRTCRSRGPTGITSRPPLASWSRQLGRNRWRRRGHDDPVVRGTIRVAEAAVGGADIDVVGEAEVGQSGAGGRGEFRVAFQAVMSGAEVGEDRRPGSRTQCRARRPDRRVGAPAASSCAPPSRAG